VIGEHGAALAWWAAPAGPLRPSRILRKKLVDTDWAGKHSLFLGEANHAFQIMAVFAQSLIKGILAEKFPLLLEVGPDEAQPDGVAA
jgi:hypothetical protein